MNKIILTGYLTADPKTKELSGEHSSKVSNYSIGVNRRRNGENVSDFFNCSCFDARADFAEKFLKKGTKVTIVGHVQTGSYTDRDGIRIPTFNVIVEEQEFAERKSVRSEEQEEGAAENNGDDYMQLPDGSEEDYPFASSGRSR